MTQDQSADSAINTSPDERETVASRPVTDATREITKGILAGTFVGSTFILSALVSSWVRPETSVTADAQLSRVTWMVFYTGMALGILWGVVRLTQTRRPALLVAFIITLPIATIGSVIIPLIIKCGLQSCSW